MVRPYYTTIRFVLRCVISPNIVQIYNYGDVIMGAIASQITSLTVVYTTVYSDADQRKYQSSASLTFVRGIHRGSVNSPHKWPVTRKMFPFDDVIMLNLSTVRFQTHISSIRFLPRKGIYYCASKWHNTGYMWRRGRCIGVVTSILP